MILILRIDWGSMKIIKILVYKDLLKIPLQIKSNFSSCRRQDIC